MVVGERYMTAEEFMEFVQRPENEGRQFELVNGVLVEEMAGGTSGKHGEVAANFLFFIKGHAREHNLGRVMAAETCFRLFRNLKGKDLVRCPDVGFVSLERAPEPFEDGYIPFAPDLAVEVISPGNLADDMHEKIRDFLRYGTKMVLVAYPDTSTLEVHTPDGARTLEAEDTFEGGDVLPGFSIQVSEFFKM